MHFLQNYTKLLRITTMLSKVLKLRTKINYHLVLFMAKVNTSYQKHSYKS